MKNCIHLHGHPFLLAWPEVESKFNHHLKILMIDKPKKIWMPKVKNQYIPLDYSDDIYNGFFDYTHYGKSVFKPKFYWKAHTRNDVITYHHAEDGYKLTKGLKIGDIESADSRERLVGLKQN